MTKKTIKNENLDPRIQAFISVFLEEIYGLDEIEPCCFDSKTLTSRHHLTADSCGVDGKKCYELGQHPTKNRAKPVAEDKKYNWCTVEMSNRMWCVFRIREEGTKIVSQFDKLIPETLKNVWREAAIQRDVYVKKPYVFSVKLKSVDKKIG
jgi:hypothetical protein